MLGKESTNRDTFNSALADIKILSVLWSGIILKGQRVKLNRKPGLVPQWISSEEKVSRGFSISFGILSRWV